jgi:hypothetical protein
MNYPVDQFKDKSFSWGFLLFAALLFVPSAWGHNLGLTKSTSGLLLGAAGSIPFLIQATTGYGLDASWTAKFGCNEHPKRFWSTLALSVVMAVWFWYIAFQRLSGT